LSKYPGVNTDVYVTRSMDNGESWEAFNEGLPTNLYITDIEFSNTANNTRIFLSSTTGLFYSDDYGESWTQNNEAPEIYFRQIVVSPADQNYAYLGGDSFYRSSDRGDTWEQLPMPVNGEYSTDIFCHPYNPDIVYHCVSRNGIFKSIDRGDTWIDINNNLPRESFFYVYGTINEHNPDNLFVTSHHHGVYQTHNGGESWETFNNGLNLRFSYSHILIDPLDTNRVCLSTGQQSVWTITRTPVSVEDDDEVIPTAYSLSQNYPNPFNAQTSISFALPRPRHVNISVYDILGRLISTPVNEFYNAGNYNINLDMTETPSGLYFYVLKTDDTEQKRKMLLLK